MRQASRSRPECIEPGPDGEAGVAGFTYELPAERIAQEPASEREAARLLVVERATRRLTHSSVRELGRWLRPGDLVVVNRSRVIAARLRGRRLPGGGGVEILLVAPVDVGLSVPAWRALVRPARRLRAGDEVELGPATEVEPGVRVKLARVGDGSADVLFPSGSDVLALAERLGEAPLPPYIRRPHGPSESDRERYQTVFALEPGSIAAPTAGLHLTQSLLDSLRASGVRIAEVVLHVGPATFLAGQPGRAALAVEPERYTVPEATRRAIVETRGRGRVVAVGTTTTRALESARLAGWPAGEQTTSLVLVPGSSFAVVEALLTNFHLPGSSLLALASAFGGIDLVRRAYATAVAECYRFYSFGDAMLIL
jgi:S-adenosylmethionine:tRNA ribosyltransferase-isomerase